MRWILTLGVILSVLHVLQACTWRFREIIPKAVRPLLIVFQEESVMTWLSVLTMSALGIVCFLVWHRTGERRWILLGGLFAYLSMDDACTFHERIGWMIEARIGRGEVYRWIQFYGPVIGLAGIWAFWTLWRLFSGIRKRQVVLLAFACLGLAMGLEVLEKLLRNADMTFRGLHLQVYTIPIEELLELTGPALLLGLIGSSLERGEFDPES